MDDLTNMDRFSIEAFRFYEPHIQHAVAVFPARYDIRDCTTTLKRSAETVAARIRDAMRGYYISLKSPNVWLTSVDASKFLHYYTGPGIGVSREGNTVTLYVKRTNSNTSAQVLPGNVIDACNHVDIFHAIAGFIANHQLEATLVRNPGITVEEAGRYYATADVAFGEETTGIMIV